MITFKFLPDIQLITENSFRDYSPYTTTVKLAMTPRIELAS